jgi:hypothetical protein
MDAMSGFQSGNFAALVNAFAFGEYQTVADLGGADEATMLHDRSASSQRHVYDLRSTTSEAPSSVRKN